jgi:MFS transporter, DHA3 family, macrolide efflux protein
MNPPQNRDPAAATAVLNRNLALLLGGQLVSQVGDKFHMLAVAFLVLATTGSTAKMGLVLFCSIFPNMLLGIVAGAVLDRCNQKHIIIAADLIRGLIVGAVGIAYALGILGFGLLCLFQILIAVCSAFFDPAIPAMIPQLVDRANLTRANAQTQWVGGIATIIGPTLGGLTVAWGGYLPVFLVNAGSYLCSAVSESFIHMPIQKPSATEKSDLGRSIMEGCRYMWRHQELGVILVTVAVIHFFVGSIEAVIPVMASGLKGDGAANLGYLQTAFGFGSVAAASFIGIRRVGGRDHTKLFGGVFLIGLLLVILGGLNLGAARNVIVDGLILAALGGAVILAGTSFRSLLQKSVITQMLGRVFGLVSSVGNISIPTAALAAGVLLEYCPHPYLLIASGAILMPLSIGGHRLYIGR